MTLRLAALASGSSGNCYLVESDGQRLLIDAGLSARAIGDELAKLDLSPNQLTAVLLSHEHSDHVGSARTLARRHHVPIFANEGTLSRAKIDPKYCSVFPTGSQTCFGKISITSFALPHDCLDPVGYFIQCEDWRICLATDLGHAPENLYDYLRAADLVILESNHDRQQLLAGPYPAFLKARILGNLGHLSNDDAAELMVNTASDRLKWLWLAHLSHTNNTPRQALRTMKSRLTQEGLDAVQVSVAQRDRLSLVWQSAEP